MKYPDGDCEAEVRLTKRRKVDTREKFAYETKWKFDKRRDDSNRFVGRS